MIGLFPHPYPDELLYSVFARYYVRSGYSNYIFVAEDLFQKRNVRPSFEYFHSLKTEVVAELTKGKNLQEIIITHTMCCISLNMISKNKGGYIYGILIYRFE